MTSSYDTIAYPTTAFAQTHPDRLATHAALFGLPFAPLATARVLDIGCGDGGNIIPMAVAYPRAQFVGFDLSQAAIARGQATVRALGLPNIRLEAMDLTTADFGAGAFDYVIAHGVYSWIPDDAREALMASIRHHMAANGVAFVSYNSLPGGRLRQLIRDMLLYRLRGVSGLQARLVASQQQLQEIIESYTDDAPFDQAVRSECQSLLDRPPEVLAHDELGDFYNPVHFHEFVDHAGRHDLQFLTEAAPNRCGEGFRPPYALDDEAFDVLAHIQDMDFRALRMYRQSLLVHAEATLNRRPEPSRLHALFASAPIRPAEDGGYESGPVRFELADPPLQAAMARLGEAWPEAVPIAALIDDDERAAVLLRMYWVGVLQLHVSASVFSTQVSDRPAASPLARLQAANGGGLFATLRHSVAEIRDEAGLRFIAGLDGSRTVDEITAAMAAATGRPNDDLRAELLGKLNELARIPLLI